jgi:zinc protease
MVLTRNRRAMNTKSSQGSLPSSFTFVRTFQGIDEFVLHNGLKVLLFLDPSQANVTINLTYLVGSRHEGRGEAGMAHLLEHMLFRGTKDVRDVKGALQDKGAQFNATTWFDRTNYYETLTPTKENLAFALKLEADRMINSLILQEDLDAEMTVVRNEFEMGENNPVHVLHDQLMSAAYRWHNYGKTTIGNRSDIERVPAKTLKKFYEHYYQPDNAVLVVAGSFIKSDALDLIHEYFAPLKRPQRMLDQTYTEEPAQDGPREVNLLRVGDMASVAVGYHIPAATHKDHAAVKVLFDVLADEPGGLLYQNLVVSEKISEVFSMTYSLYEPGMALCFVRPTEDALAESIKDELIDLVEEKAHGFLTDIHVERIKTRALKRIKQSMANSKDLALKLSEAIACGDWRLFFWYRDQIKNVSLADVKRVLATYIINSNRTSGVFRPDRAPKRAVIEQAPPLASFIDAVAEDASMGAGEAFLASAKNIESLVARKDISASRHVGILPKKTRGQVVRANFRFRFGNQETITPFAKEFWLVPSMLWRGTTKYDYQGLRDRVDACMSTLDIDGHAGLLLASIKSEREHLGAMVDLLSHMLSESTFKAEEFAVVRQREIDNYEEIKSDPQRLGFHELERLKNPWPKGHILYVHSYDEIIDEMKALSLEKIQKAHQQLFSTEHFFVSVVGDVDSERLLGQLQGKFANMPDRTLFERIKRPFIKNIAEDVLLDTQDKEMAIIAYAVNFPMRDDHDDFPALKLANYMFGENMNSRLMTRIREKEGISYGAGSSIEISRYEENASLNLYAMASPQSVSRAKKAIEEEWTRFIAEGFNEDELKMAKESIWLSFENNLASDSFLASALAHDLECGRDFFSREKRYLAMQNLSLTDLKKAAQAWWGKAQFSKVVAADQKKLV